ncbi:hypothetical protein [Verrucomicrobium spinosum]|uniref:hypothetical protein n=1 Tax=Verrucomicrobium spinosum TaxID=2736 RepID=UPI000ACF4F8E|nr:hypothetical protein [Verrucomicrobium spinosum]
MIRPDRTGAQSPARQGCPALCGDQLWRTAQLRRDPAAGPIPDALARQLKHGYYAAISYMDARSAGCWTNWTAWD